MKNIILILIVTFIAISCAPRETEREKITKALEKNKTAILKELNGFYQKKEYRNILWNSKKFVFLKDKDIMVIRAKAERQLSEPKVQRLLTELKKVPASQWYVNRSYYEDLLKLRPDNEKFKKKHAYYEGKIKNIHAKFGKQPVQGGWSGTSYSEVESYLKKVANDPGSIVIDSCTRVYRDKKEGWIVGCDYRGKNAFGAMVRNSNWFVIRHRQVVKVKPASAYTP